MVYMKNKIREKCYGQFIYGVANSSSQGYCGICLTYFKGDTSLVGGGTTTCGVGTSNVSRGQVSTWLNKCPWVNVTINLQCVCIYSR